MDNHPGLSDAAWAAVSSRTRLAVLLLCETGSFTVTEIADELGIKRPLTNYHVQNLETAGLVREAGRVAIPGGPLISYTAVRKGWAAYLRGLDELAKPPNG